MEDWILGMILVLLGCCCSAVGLVLLKHSTNVEEHLPLHRRPFWATGVVFLIVNASVIDVIAFSLAPLTLVAPFSGVTIVLTTWLASSGLLFVKETVDMWDVTSTAIALVGVTMTTTFGPHVDEAKGANELAACFGQLDVHIFAAVSFGIFGLVWLLYFSTPWLREMMPFRICVYAYTAALAGSASMLLLKVVGTAAGGKCPLASPQPARCLPRHRPRLLSAERRFSSSSRWPAELAPGRFKPEDLRPCGLQARACAATLSRATRWRA